MIHKGDCLDFLKQTNNNFFDLIVTDPPYKTTKRGNSGGTGGMLKNKDFIKGNGGFKHNDINQIIWLKECFRVLKNDKHFYCFTNNKNLKQTLIDIESVGFKIFKTLIWAKDNCITNMYYMDSHEYIIFAYKGKAVKINNCGTRSVLNYKNVKNKTHPSEKPTELLTTILLNSSKENDICFDPFGGSGSFSEVCEKNNREWVVCEIDDTYQKYIQDRMENINNQKTLF